MEYKLKQKENEFKVCYRDIQLNCRDLIDIGFYLKNKPNNKSQFIGY